MSLFVKALDFALRKAGKDSDISLKAQQKEIIETIASSKKLRCVRGFTDRIREVTRFPFVVFDFVECEGPPVKGKAITVVTAPLNALLFYRFKPLTRACFPCICINEVWVTRKITTRGSNQQFQIKFFSIKREYLRKHCLMPKALITHQAMAKNHPKAKIAKKYYARTAKPFAYRITLQICKFVNVNTTN